MKKVIISLSILCGVLFASEISSSKIVKLSQKGEKITKTLCVKEKLPTSVGTIEQVMENIKKSKACPPLSKTKLEAVAYYLSNGSMKHQSNQIAVPSNAKCPVCGMIIYKYPKWAASITMDGKKYYFDGVKDMMKYYIFDGDFPYDRKAISEILVSDYYTLEAIPAKEAYYVNDSDVFGPMGRELIPFKSEKSAKSFVEDHNGKGIVKFDAITDVMVMTLDGLEVE